MSVARIDGLATATCGVCGATWKDPLGDFNLALRILRFHIEKQHKGEIE